MCDHRRRRPEKNPDQSMPGTMLVMLTRGFVAIVDEADAESVGAYNWCASISNRMVYAVRGFQVAGKQKQEKLHKFLWRTWGLELTEVDHANGDTMDNRRANLRPATRSQNRANSRISSNNTSGYKGVCRSGDKWRAAIGSRPAVLLGVYDTPEEAHAAYVAAARARFGEFAKTG